MAYPEAEMAFCSHCGKAANGARFCPACGAPIAPDAVKAMTAELRNYHKKLRLTVAAFSLVLVVGATVMYMERVTSRPSRGGEVSAPTLQPQQPLPSEPAAAQTPPGQTGTLGSVNSQPPQPPVTVPDENRPTSPPSRSSIDQQAVHSALNNMMQQRAQQGDSSVPRSSTPALPSSGSDRYPGSQPVEIKDANVPDIGVPTSREIYTTSDSVATVVSYYQQRYPDAELTDMEGQKIIAINRPGATKVIAVGTNGTETRIAIVQAAAN